MHDQALREFGGIHGVKSPDLLESALARPLNLQAYADPAAADLADLAAAYAFGLAKNHAFNDGNKRTAWACCVLFLKLNGVTLALDPAVVVEQMVRLAEGSITERDFATWLRS